MRYTRSSFVYLVYFMVKLLPQLTKRQRLDPKPPQSRLRNIPRATSRSQLFAAYDIGLPVLGVERLHNTRRARSLTGKGSNEEYPFVCNRSVALQHLRLSRHIPAIVRCTAFLFALVRRRLNLECRAILRDEVEGSVYLASRWQTVEDIADKILGEHADVGVLVCQIPKRPAVEGKDLKETGYWR